MYDAEEIRELFEQCDKDGNGLIDFNEFCELVEALEGELSDEEKRIGFDVVDANQDGRINFDEFVAWWSE